MFKPQAAIDRTSSQRTAGEGDLVWIGNWGDDERSAELHEFLIGPALRLGLAGRVYGVRYPADAREALNASGLIYSGWLPNYRVPMIFSRFHLTIHIPRRPYVTALPGIPTIRPFEALACGIPLICSPWEDVERLFTPGKDYLVARNGREMEEQIKVLLHEPSTARALAEHGYRTILERHTCRHRVDELLAIGRELGLTEPTFAHTPSVNGVRNGTHVLHAPTGLYHKEKSKNHEG